jgi:DNA repair photolyase
MDQTSSKPRGADRRGAASNESGRFERLTRQRESDGWDAPPEDWDTPTNDQGAEDWLPSPATTVGLDASRTVLTRNRSPDLPFDRSVNPYRGCEHGCSYCFARPSHAYLGLSPGLDFETRLSAKPDAAAQLERELRKPGYTAAPLAMGTNTDPYQPIEGRLGITRGILEVLSAFNHPLSITTKSAAVTRDLPLLADMAARNLVQVGISVTSLDRDLSRRLEPRASPPAARLAAIRRLSEAGIPTTVMLAPVIPGLTDMEIEAILTAAAEAGAGDAVHILLRLPLEVAPLFTEWLERHAPNRKDRVLSLVRQCREGALYRSDFGHRLAGQGPVAEAIGNRVALAKRRLGLGTAVRRFALDSGRFRLPPRPGDQLTLF